MNRPALPEERGAGLQADAPTLSELQAAHEWRTEERADGRYIVDVCRQCGHEESAGARSPFPDCEVHEVSDRFANAVIAAARERADHAAGDVAETAIVIATD